MNKPLRRASYADVSDARLASWGPQGEQVCDEGEYIGVLHIGKFLFYRRRYRPQIQRLPRDGAARSDK